MSEVSQRRTVPMVDQDSVPYWSALAAGRFLLQHCDQCGRWTWPPRPICSGCHGDQLTWQAPGGTGTVYSWVVTHQPYAPDLARIVPYTTALVRIDEHGIARAREMAQQTGVPPERIAAVVAELRNDGLLEDQDGAPTLTRVGRDYAERAVAVRRQLLSEALADDDAHRDPAVDDLLHRLSRELVGERP